MRWLITGANGQVGTHLGQLLNDESAVSLGRAELDITAASSVDQVVRSIRPDVVINAAAYTTVDAAEQDEPAASAVNCAGAGNVARAVARHGGRLVHISTDYVFDGNATHPYEPDDRPAPRTAYGRTKLAGELAVREALPDRSAVVRTAWIFGGPSVNFVDTMLRLERERQSVDVVADQIGSPTYAGDLASALIALGRDEFPAAVLHYVNGGTASWYELARETFRLAGADPTRVRRTTSEHFQRPAPRPAWSVLSTARWTAVGLPPPRDWQAALADYLADKP